MFLLALTLACCLFSQVHSFPENCKPLKNASRYRHCVHRPDGVQHLECFGKYKKYTAIKCEWKPGNNTSKEIYTLTVEQDNLSMACHNITAHSQVISIFRRNMTVHVYAESAECTRAVFRAAPKSLWRCDPPNAVNFSRQRGSLHVSVRWSRDEAVKSYSVRYKVQGSDLWTEPVPSHNRQSCTVDNLNSSLFYAVQIQCAINNKCSQCPWSNTYTVPSELTAPPALVDLKDADVTEQKGSRVVSLKWKFPASESHDGFYITVAKATGEGPVERLRTTRPEITLILSYSSYHLNVSAVNNVSESPAARHTVPHKEQVDQGKLNMTVHNNTSFTVHWRHDLIRTYVCYALEWRTEGRKPMIKSFYENRYNGQTLSFLPELEPYKRYIMTLHTRPDKQVCNIKSINRSESTYGSTHFYYIQGAPVGAPNISVCNLTLDSVVVRWTPVPQEQARGFLQGYVIYYSHHRGAITERNVSVGPDTHTSELKDLEAGTMYRVELAAVTQAGAGVRSLACIFKTHYKGHFLSTQNGLIILFAVAAAVLIFASLIIKRRKDILWPSIPNPENSNAMQKIEEPCEMELLESTDHLEAEESANSLQIVAARPLITLQSLTVHDSDDETAEMLASGVPDPAGSGGFEPAAPTTTCTQSSPSPCAFQSGYTTMEMFQQGAVARCDPPDATSEPDHVGLCVSRSAVDGEYTAF